MRIVADNEQEYKDLIRVQKVLTGLYNLEENQDLKNSVKQAMRTPIEKSYERPGQSAKIANDADLDTEDRELIVPYLVHAAVNRLKCAIAYTDGKGKTSQRLIEPVSWRNDQVVAFCHERGAWRQFKPKNIARIAVTKEAFDMPLEDHDPNSDTTQIIADHAKTMAALAR